MQTLLDGAKMPAKIFYKKFREIVGVSFVWWIKRENVKSWGNGEMYDYQDEDFLIGGTAYDPPRLFKKPPKSKSGEPKNKNS